MMRFLFAIAVIATTLTACGDSYEATSAPVDSVDVTDIGDSE